LVHDFDLVLPNPRPSGNVLVEQSFSISAKELSRAPLSMEFTRRMNRKSEGEMNIPEKSKVKSNDGF
jgi:hypothetical protein